ncbi:MAG: calcium-binding protein [Symploca sp. SIO2C1]|nr:calcium-binding protein [Symploca sp. SIO2C1]
MRILFTIAHFFEPNPTGKYASQGKTSLPRLQALSQSITALHQLFGQTQCNIDIGQRLALPANQPQAHELEIVVCTTGKSHLLHQLPLPSSFYKHHSTQAEPMLLGFECQAVLRDYLGQYDYYCFLEDDLILHDPWLFIKLGWLTQRTGDQNLLQPNRYEVSTDALTHKAYIDGDLAPHVTAPFQNVHEQPELKGKIMETPITFRRTLNPHAGCYFLNANQMRHWANQTHFLDRDTSFIGPLESAATLGIMKTFRVYKTLPEQAGFLEIQHFGTKYLNLIGKKVSWEGHSCCTAPVEAY